MRPDGIIDLFLSHHPPSVPLLTFGELLNKLGKGDALAFICILLAILGYFFLKPLWVKSAAGGILTVISSGAVVQTLKHIFGRSRPQMNLGDLHFIGPNLLKDGFDSFPSGHATASFAMAAFFSFYFPRFRILFYSVAALISVFGRVLMRHHYMSDVIAGGLIGAGIGFLIAKKLKKWITEPSVFQTTVNREQVKSFGSKKEESSRGNLKALLIVIAFSSVILLTGLTQSALWDRDETEYAQSVLEMQEKGEWLIPTLEGAPFIEKPILMFWFVRASYLVFGANEFSSRFPSALFGILTCIAVYFLGKTIAGNSAGLLSAIILSTSFLFSGGFRFLLTDPFFVFFITLSFLFYILSWKKAENAGKFMLFAYSSIGLAILSKGPFALFPLIIFITSEFFCGGNSSFVSLFTIAFRHALFSLIALAIASPWFIYSFGVQKEATTTFFMYDNILRFLKGAEGHTGPMLYYMLVLLPGFLPWSFFLFPYLREEWRNRMASRTPMERGTVILTLWAFFIFIFFSVCSNKLPHYMLPMLPPLSCLTARYWTGHISENSNLSILSFKLTLFTSILLTLAPLSLYFARPQYASIKLISPFLIFFLFIAAAFFFSKKNAWRKSFAAISLGSLFLFLSCSLYALPWIEKFRVMKPIALAVKKNVPPGAQLIGYHLSEPSLFFYGGRLFPKVEGTPLDSILKGPKQAYVILHESRLKENPPITPYTVLERAEGFAENGGEMAVLLITNAHP